MRYSETAVHPIAALRLVQCKGTYVSHYFPTMGIICSFVSLTVTQYITFQHNSQ